MAMLVSHLYFLVIVLVWIACVSCQNLLYTVIEGQSCDDMGYDVATDRSGNVYITGATCNATTQWRGAFISKYSPDGQKLWKKSFGNNLYDTGFAVVVDKEDNVYVAARFYLKGTGWTGTAVVLKYDPNGSVLSSLRFGTSPTNDQPLSLGIDANNNLFVTGVYNANVLQQTFLRKYNSSGVLIFDQIFGTPGFSNKLALDSQGDVYLTGTTSGSAFLVKFANNGTQLYSKLIGLAGATTVIGRGLAVDSHDNVYLVGDQERSQQQPYQGALMYKFSSNGTQLFSTGWGYSGSDKALAVAVDAQDNVYVTGYVDQTIDGSIKYIYHIHIPVIKFSPTGELLQSWYVSSATADDAGQGIHVDTNNNLYVTGYVGGSINNVPAYGSRDNFILKYGLPSPAPSMTPSRRPTYTPSSRPTSTPTSVPSAEPSSAPSGQPTIACVSLETVRRAEELLSQANRLVEEAKALLNALSIPSTLSPTQSPSCSPSHVPSWMPSSKPSSRPSSAPSSVPSAQPTTPCVSLETVRKAKAMLKQADELFDEAFSLLAAASKN